MKRLANAQGFTLLEAITAMLILTIGILAVAAMQGYSIRSSTVSYDRTEANSIATALIETFQALDFDDPAFEPTGSGDGDLNDFDNAHIFEMHDLDKRLDSLVTVPAPESGKIVDHAGLTYDLKWTVQNMQKADDAASTTVAKNVRIRLEWPTPYGVNHLVYTTAKYKNKAL